jgi:hypothetical protein
MPVKWKIFKIIQITALVILAPLILLDIYGILTKPVSKDEFNSFVFGQAVFFFLSLIYCGNILLNLKLLSAALINKQAGTINRRFSIALLILFILVITILAAAFIAVLYSEFLQPVANPPLSKTFYTYILLYLFILIAAGTCISIMQVKLLRLIGYHKKERINSVIESIGSPEKESGK